VKFYGISSEFNDKDFYIQELPTISEVSDSNNTNYSHSDSTFNALEKHESIEEEIFLKKLHQLDLDYFNNSKWGYATEFNFLYSPPDTQVTTPTLVYIYKYNVNLDEYLFSKKGDKILLYEDNTYTYYNYEKSNKYVKYKIKNSSLYVKIGGKFELLFSKNNENSGIANYYGRFYFNKHYESIEFLNYSFNDIYEFYQIDLRSTSKGVILLWFDKNYNLIRRENINPWVTNEGFLFIDNTIKILE
jgi:hypothetical protein